MTRKWTLSLNGVLFHIEQNNTFAVFKAEDEETIVNMMGENCARKPTEEKNICHEETERVDVLVKELVAAQLVSNQFWIVITNPKEQPCNTLDPVPCHSFFNTPLHRRGVFYILICVSVCLFGTTFY